MNQISKKDQFYREVGQAMSIGESRSFVNMDTLKVDIHASEDYFSYGDMEDTAKEALENPDKFLALEPISSHDSFRTMEAFIETVKDKYLKRRLIEALEYKKPFANFKKIIDNSTERQNWFQFRDDAFAAIAKEWLEENAPEELLEKIRNLPAVFKAE